VLERKRGGEQPPLLKERITHNEQQAPTRRYFLYFLWTRGGEVTNLPSKENQPQRTEEISI